MGLQGIENEGLASSIQQVAEFLQRFGTPEGKTVILPLESVSYYPHLLSAVRQRPDFNLLYRRFWGTSFFIDPEDIVEIKGVSTKGRLIVDASSRRLPYTATLEIEKAMGLNGRGMLEIDEYVTKILLSPQAFHPFNHVILGVANEHTDGSVYTVDTEKSQWSFHLAPPGYDYDRAVAEVRGRLYK